GGENDSIWQLETNIDDVPAEVIGYTVERLFAAGALDVFTTPIQMKKLRPGGLVTGLCMEDDRTEVGGVLFAGTGKLGVRRSRKERTKLPRKEASVQTAWGSVAGKCAFESGEWKFSPEYDVCAAIAKRHGIPLRDVYAAAVAAYSPGR